MTNHHYLNGVLTAIAVALAAIAAENFVKPAHAQLGLSGCGDLVHPCYVTTAAHDPLLIDGVVSVSGVAAPIEVIPIK